MLAKPTTCNPAQRRDRDFVELFFSPFPERLGMVHATMTVVVYSLALITLFVGSEPRNPGYCSRSAIGYVRMVNYGARIAGGAGTFDSGPAGYRLTAWFPADRPRVTLILDIDHDLALASVHGQGDVRKQGEVWCAFSSKR
jgi:hypothetical protein